MRLGEKEALDALARFFEDRRATQLKRLVYYQERRLRRLGLVDDGEGGGAEGAGCGVWDRGAVLARVTLDAYGTRRPEDLVVATVDCACAR